MRGIATVKMEVWDMDISWLLRECAREECRLLNVESKSPGRCEITVDIRDIRTLIRLIRQKKGRMHIVEKKGIYFWQKRLQKRKSFLWGAAIFFAVVYLGTSFIWAYDIQGNEAFSQQDVIAILEEYGLSKGACKNNFDYEQLAKKILLDYNQTISWIWLKPTGVVLEVRIKEKDENEVHLNPADLVCTENGEIAEILVLHGTAGVSQGDYVHKNQVLVEGVEYGQWERDAQGLFVPIGQKTPVRAKGVISGYVTYSAIGECARSEGKLAVKGDAHRRYMVWFGQKHILSGKACADTVLQKTLWEKAWQWNDNSAGIGLVEEYPAEHTIRQYTLEEAYEESLKRAREELEQKAGEYYEIKQEVIMPENIGTADAVRVKVQWTVLKNIAEAVEKPQE